MSHSDRLRVIVTAHAASMQATDEETAAALLLAIAIGDAIFTGKVRPDVVLRIAGTTMIEALRNMREART